jgi:hypothetical protein
MVSAGLVYDVSGETAAARIDGELLARVAKATGGQLLAEGATSLSSARAAKARFVDLTPWLLILFLLLFLVDIAIRRWENVLGVYDWTVGLLLKRA